jgi:WD40 repeat protein
MRINLTTNVTRSCLFVALLLSFIPQMAAQPTPVRLRETRNFQGLEDQPDSIVFSPDGRTLAASDSFKIVLWDVASGQVLHTLQGLYNIGGGKPIDLGGAVAFSPDGRTLALGNRDGAVILLWDLDTWTLVGVLNCELRVKSVAFSPDGRTLASGGWTMINTDLEHRHQIFFGELRLWDVASKKPLRTLQAPKTHLAFGGPNTDFAADAVQWVSFSPDGRTLASEHLDGSLRLWDVVSGEISHVLKADVNFNFAPVAFSPNGHTLASGTDKDRGGTIHLWDVASGRLLRTLQGHRYGTWSVAFSPDGRTLASAGNDSEIKNHVTTVKLWDLVRGVPLYAQQSHANADYLAFSPDGLTLATGGEDKIVRLWEVTGLHK